MIILNKKANIAQKSARFTYYFLNTYIIPCPTRFLAVSFPRNDLPKFR